MSQNFEWTKQIESWKKLETRITQIENSLEENYWLKKEDLIKLLSFVEKKKNEETSKETKDSINLLKDEIVKKADILNWENIWIKNKDELYNLINEYKELSSETSEELSSLKQSIEYEPNPKNYTLASKIFHEKYITKAQSWDKLTWVLVWSTNSIESIWKTASGLFIWLWKLMINPVKEIKEVDWKNIV